ncbi:hypothetical protein [Bacillus cereus]|nr:hypothetical protein [Bacillus cereus]
MTSTQIYCQDVENRVFEVLDRSKRKLKQVILVLASFFGVNLEKIKPGFIYSLLLLAH